LHLKKEKKRVPLGHEEKIEGKGGDPRFFAHVRGKKEKKGFLGGLIRHMIEKQTLRKKKERKNFRYGGEVPLGGKKKKREKGGYQCKGEKRRSDLATPQKKKKKEKEGRYTPEMVERFGGEGKRDVGGDADALVPPPRVRKKKKGEKGWTQHSKRSYHSHAGGTAQKKRSLRGHSFHSGFDKRKKGTVISSMLNGRQGERGTSKKKKKRILDIIIPV